MDAPEADVTHCLQTNRSSSNAVGEGSAPATDEGTPCWRSSAGGSREAHPAAAMPCRRSGGEHFLLLESAVSLQGGGGGSGGSKEVDALVARLGEVLQLGASPRQAKYRGRDRVAPYSSPKQGLGWLASLHRRHHPRPSLLLLQPPPAPASTGSPRGSKELCGRGWLRSAARAAAGGKKKQQQQQHPLLLEEEEDDPHRLLQQLILSGNLIKEAVRRLQLAATAASTAETSSTDSSGSTSSIGSCHSEGDSAASAAGGAGTTFAVSPLQPLP